jgi:nitrogen-specific signal transduction histidine kinase
VEAKNVSGRSLLDYLDAPVLVGDPEGQVVHLNPAFERQFDVSLEDARGGMVAAVFEGGARESLLCAVAEVCGGKSCIRFQVREQGSGYNVMASPISADSDRVGVIILFEEERRENRQALDCTKGMQIPLDELGRCLSDFSERLGRQGDERNRAVLDDATKALETLRKGSDELMGLLSGGSTES